MLVIVASQAINDTFFLFSLPGVLYIFFHSPHVDVFEPSTLASARRSLSTDGLRLRKGLMLSLLLLIFQSPDPPKPGEALAVGRGSTVKNYLHR
jgi:hypothetical protein